MQNYEIFEEFFKRVYYIAKKSSSYYGLTFEELKQEVAIVYYENEVIEKLYVSGRETEAFRIFGSAFSKSAKDFSITGIQVERNKEYERSKALIDNAGAKTETDFNLENEIMTAIEIERLKNIYGEEDIDDVLEYYEIGYERYAMKNGMTGAAARTKISRRISKIKSKEV